MVVIKKLWGKFLQMGFDKHPPSELDNFLNDFDQQHPEKSSSQQHEISKHARIAQLRDKAMSDKDKPSIWSDF